MSTRIISFTSVLLLLLMGAWLCVEALPPLPPDHLQPEMAWIKEEGLPKETWGQYNDTGPNRLNLTYRHSAANMAYVIRSSDPSDEVNATFIAYRNISSSNGFNSTGHLFPGSFPVWSLKIAIAAEQTAGDYTYHIFIATFDPEGKPGLYQVRINLSGTIEGGSDWSQPAGNPAVPWMFFQVPEGTSWPVSVSDQLGRYSPFFFDTPIPTTHLNASLVIEPPGNSTGASKAVVRWNHTNGTTLLTRNPDIYYVGDGRWATRSVIEADNSTFPANYTHPYRVSVRMGTYQHSASFYVYPIYAAIRPNTWLTKSPPAITDNRTVEFEWIGSDLDGKVIAYEYRRDSGSWIETTDTERTYQLGNGTHRFEVRAKDDDGLLDPSPAFKDFVVKINSPPETQILQKPNATTDIRDIYFSWQGSDIDGTVASFEYRMDETPWIPTLSKNTTYLNMSSGSHRFEVRSVDNKGLRDPTPASYNFTISPSWCERELERLNLLIETLGERISDLEDSIADLEALLNDCENEKATLTRLVNDLNAEKAELESLVEDLEQDKRDLESENADLQAQLESCLEMNRALQGVLAENEQLRIANDFLLGLIDQLRDRIDELEQQIPEVPTAALPPIAFAVAWLLSITARRRP